MRVNLVSVVLLGSVTALTPSPAPSASPAADPCMSSGHTSLLAALNRPTVGFSACSVKTADFVSELGYANQSGDSGAVQYPQGFLRYGVGPGVEVDVIGPAYQTARGGASGFLDSGVGAKWEFSHTQSTASAIDFLYTAPVGATPLTAGTPSETLNFDYGATIGAQLGFGLTAGIERTGGFTTLLPSFVFTKQNGSRAQLYIEAFWQTKTSSGGSLFGADGGWQYLITPQLEVDVEAGRTVAPLSRNHYYGFGVGLRL
jgi:hypothetical protein